MPSLFPYAFQHLKKFFNDFWMQYLTLMPRQDHSVRPFTVNSMASFFPGQLESGMQEVLLGLFSCQL